MPVYNYALTAAQVPPPISPGDVALLSVVGAVTQNAKTFTTGQVARSASHNENAVRVDLAGRFGGGSYGIVKGLALDQTVAGKVDVGPGQAMLDGISQITATTQVALTSSEVNWVFLKTAGVLQVVASAGAPANPVPVCCFIGRVVVDAGGNITDYDLSGVVSLRGGTPYRRTADATTPADAPPATLTLLTKGDGYLWLWAAGAYWLQQTTITPTLQHAVCDNGEVQVYDEEIVWLT